MPLLARQAVFAASFGHAASYETRTHAAISPSVKQHGLGKWIWQQKKKWATLSLIEKMQLLALRSFNNFNPATFETEEWNRVFRLCCEFECKNNTDISPKDVVGDDAIGKWLTSQKRAVTLYLQDGSDAHSRNTQAQREMFEKLNTLCTVKNWRRTRKRTWAEEMQAKIEESIKRAREFVRKETQQQQGASSSQPPPITPKKQTPWEILQLAQGAPPEVVKAAYKALCLLHHPDKGGETARFVAIKAAYEELTK